MADTVADAAPAPAGSPKKAKQAAAKKPKAKASHPPTSEMVLAAIKNLKERGGSSLQAIKKYITSNYKVDAEKLAPFIKKYLKSAVTSGSLVQTKGKGASGSFKLSTAEKSDSGKKAAKTTTAARKPAVKKQKPTTPKKTTAAAAKKVKAPAAAKKPKAAKSPSKAKKTVKTPTKKPKAPKPKKAAAKPKAAAAKKAKK